MHDTIAPVLPMRPRPARTRKPNRRPGSCPASPPDSAAQFAANLVAADRMTATRIAQALMAILGSPSPTPGQAAYLTELAQ